MKFPYLAAASSVIALWFASSVSAAVPEIRCSNDAGFHATLQIEGGTGLGYLTYGQGEETIEVTDLDTSFVDDLGAATKGGQVLFVVSPIGDLRIGQLLVGGKTYIMSCES